MEEDPRTLRLTTNDTLHFLSTLYQDTPGGWLELRFIAPKGSALRSPLVEWFPMPLDNPQALLRAITTRNQAGYNVHFGVALRRQRKDKGAGKKEDALYLTALWAETDAKDFGGDLEAARQAIERHNPTVIIFTGGGWHGYWLLEALLEITDGNRADIERTLKGLAKATGGDRAVAEIARVMRLPGTINTKPERNNARCEVVSVTDRRYSFGELYLDYAPLIPDPKPKVQAALETDGDELRRALFCIPPDVIDYNEWLAVLAALRHELGASEAVALAEQWTGHCSKPGEVAAKIKSFEKGYSGTPATAGTIFHLARQYGYAPPQREPREKPVKLSYDERPVLPEPTPEPLTLRAYAPYMFVCPEYALIHLHTMTAGIADDFTAAQLAEIMGCSKDKAQRMINVALEWELVGEGAAKLKTIDTPPDSILFNSAARHYHLTPKRGYDMVLRELPHRVLAVLEAPEPGRVGKDEAAETGLNAALAEQIEVTTAVIADTDEALEVSARAERRAWELAREIERLAEYDDTPFTPDTLPGSVRELRTMLIEALIATKPDGVWRHYDFVPLVGVKRDSISYLIAKSSKIAPAPNPVFRDFPIEGEDKHKAVRARCREHHGAPVAWLDARGEVISPFSRDVPKNAAGIKLNCGKTYVKRDPATVTAEPVDAPAPDETPVTEPEPVDEEKQAQRRAQLQVLPRLRGCLEARGWRHFPGPYGYWERDDKSYPNTWEGIVEALLTDYEWAAEQAKQIDIATDPLFETALELGAVIKPVEMKSPFIRIRMNGNNGRCPKSPTRRA
jgi:hypothetical protein